MTRKTRIKLTKNYLEDFIDIPVGTKGTVIEKKKSFTMPGRPVSLPPIVRVKFDNGIEVRAWMTIDGHGDATIALA